MVKYKLDCMRKKMETQERNATSRASFKCVQCFKTFTDLEVCSKIVFNSNFYCTLLCVCYYERSDYAFNIFLPL